MKMIETNTVCDGNFTFQSQAFPPLLIAYCTVLTTWFILTSLAKKLGSVSPLFAGLWVQREPQSTHRPLWIFGWRRPLRSPHSSLLRPPWRRSSSSWLSQCPPWPGPGRCLGVPRGRRSRSGCCRLTRARWMRSSPGGSAEDKHTQFSTTGRLD